MLPRLRGALQAYFDSSVDGLEKVPDGPALLVANHSGGSTPVESIVFVVEYLDRLGVERPLYWLGHDALLRLPVVGDFVRRCGVIPAGWDVAADTLRAGGQVVVYPGGELDLHRPWTARHEIRFEGRSGFVALATRRRRPDRADRRDRRAEHVSPVDRRAGIGEGVRHRPVRAAEGAPVAFAFPWGVSIGPLPHLPLPARIGVQVLDPIDVSGVTDDEIPTTYADIVATMQKALDELVEPRRANVPDRTAQSASQADRSRPVSCSTSAMSSRNRSVRKRPLLRGHGQRLVAALSGEAPRRVASAPLGTKRRSFFMAGRLSTRFRAGRFGGADRVLCHPAVSGTNDVLTPRKSYRSRMSPSGSSERSSKKQTGAARVEQLVVRSELACVEAVLHVAPLVVAGIPSSGHDRVGERERLVPLRDPHRVRGEGPVHGLAEDGDQPRVGDRVADLPGGIGAREVRRRGLADRLLVGRALEARGVLLEGPDVLALAPLQAARLLEVARLLGRAHVHLGVLRQVPEERRRARLARADDQEVRQHHAPKLPSGPGRPRGPGDTARRPTLEGHRALVAQWIEHLTTDQKVGGSTPSERAPSDKDFFTGSTAAPRLWRTATCSNPCSNGVSRRRRTAQHVVHPVGRLALHVGEDVRVDVARSRKAAVAQRRLNHLQVDAAGEHERRRRVSEVVKPDPSHTGRRSRNAPRRGSRCGARAQFRRGS